MLVSGEIYDLYSNTVFLLVTLVICVLTCGGIFGHKSNWDNQLDITIINLDLKFILKNKVLFLFEPCCSSCLLLYDKNNSGSEVCCYPSSQASQSFWSCAWDLSKHEGKALLLHVYHHNEDLLCVSTTKNAKCVVLRRLHQSGDHAPRVGEEKSPHPNVVCLLVEQLEDACLVTFH